MDPVASLRGYQFVEEAIQGGWVSAAHDCSDGGLAVTLAEMAFSGGFGLAVDLGEIEKALSISLDELLFSESAGRIVISVRAEKLSDFRKAMDQLNGSVHVFELGETTPAKTLQIKAAEGASVELDNQALKSAWQDTLRDF